MTARQRDIKAGSPDLVVNGRRLTFKGSWVQIPTLDTGWTFLHIIFVVKIVMLF